MGIYWTTTLYHGRLLSPAAFTRLSNKRMPAQGSKSYITKVCPDRWIVHAPKMRLVLGKMDPIIDHHEKEAGSVQGSEVDRIFARHPELSAEWNSSEAADLQELKKLVVLAASDETAEPGTHICEVQWSTLQPDIDDSCLTYNLRVT